MCYSLFLTFCHLKIKGAEQAGILWILPLSRMVKPKIEMLINHPIIV
jgi:hypothetical protein